MAVQYRSLGRVVRSMDELPTDAQQNDMCAFVDPERPNDHYIAYYDQGEWKKTWFLPPPRCPECGKQ